METVVQEGAAAPEVDKDLSVAPVVELQEDEGLDWAALADENTDEGVDTLSQESVEGAGAQGQEPQDDKPARAEVGKLDGTAAVQPTPASTADPAVQSAAAPTPPPVPSTPIPAEQAQQPAAQAAPAATAPLNQEQQGQQYQAWRNGHLSTLQQQYQISDEEAGQLMTEPEKVIPALLARAHLNALESAVTAVQAILPSMLHQHTQVQARENQARSLFNGVNPDLADPSYEQAILTMGKVFRQTNQRASPEEAARAIGNLVRVAFGLPAPQPMQAAPVAQPQHIPAAPFRPTRGGPGGVVQQNSNPFTQLAEEFLRDDDF